MDEQKGFPFPRESDPYLYDLYAKKLLQPGWAGHLSLSEAMYIQSKLEADVNLRRRWRTRRKKVPLILIAELACPEDPQGARHKLENEMRRVRGY